MKKIGLFVYRFLPIILILALGGYLRLHKIDQYMTFLGDEGRDVLTVKRMIVDGKWTLLGPTASVGGFFMGPIYYYFMLPFLWAWKLNPVGPAIMVALFGIVTIFLVYYTGKKMISPRVGIIASLFYALSPLVISYSRSSWNPNIVPFFALFSIYFLWRSARYDSWNDLFWELVQKHIQKKLFWILFVLLILWFINTFHSVLTPFILAGIVSYILNPLVDFLVFKLKLSRTMCALIIYFIIVLL